MIVDIQTRGTQSVAYPLAYKFDPMTLTFDRRHWRLIGFQILFRTKYVPSFVKIHWRMLILECSQRCYAVKFNLLTLTFDLWPWKSIRFQILLRTKYVRSLVKIHWRIFILECSQWCYEERTDCSVTISFRNFVGEGIIMCVLMVSIFLFIWFSIGFWKCSESIIFVFCNFILSSNRI